MKRAVLIGSLVLAAGPLAVHETVAQPALGGTTWVDDDCMIGFNFKADGRFVEFSLDDGDYHGNWWLDGWTLTLQYDGGSTVRTPINGNDFSLRWEESDGGSGFTCVFSQD